MNTNDFDYFLPSDLVAQKSVEPRDHSRLMVIDREKKIREDKYFYEIVDSLQSGDLLVWNNSKVFKARLLGKLLTQNNEGLWDHKRDVEIFLVRPMENEGVWQVLGKPGKHIAPGTRVEIASDFWCDVLIKEKEGTILVQFFTEENKCLAEDKVRQLANQYGHIPIPPYVKDELHEIESYQTVYSKHEGSVAAPTAGFHFTPDLIEKLKTKGIEFAEVTLHVGLGTFLPVKSERVEDHTMHSEWIEITPENAEKINAAKIEGRRVIAVGTTTVRTLEAVALIDQDGGEGHCIHPYKGDVNIFIKPGFEFKVVDGLITNFHLPKSTLLMLVSAFAGDKEFIMKSYEYAVEKKYRFFSFGDAMFIQS